MLALVQSQPWWLHGKIENGWWRNVSDVPLVRSDQIPHALLIRGDVEHAEMVNAEMLAMQATAEGVRAAEKMTDD